MQGMRRPKLFWVGAGAPLATVVLSTVIAYLIKAENHGISTVRILLNGYKNSYLLYFLDYSSDFDFCFCFMEYVYRLENYNVG